MSSIKSRKSRFNSFELSDSEQSTQSLTNMIVDLQKFFPSMPLDFTEIDSMIENSKQAVKEEEFPDIQIYNIKLISNIRANMVCIEALKSIRSVMKEIRQNVAETNWDLLVTNGFKVQAYHSFVYTLMKLIEVVPDDKINRDLAFNAGRTYFMLLALPGAKRCLIWDERLVLEFFKLFDFEPSRQEDKRTSSHDYDDRFIEIQIIQMLNECQIVFNIVCLSDQENILEKYLEMLKSTLSNFMSNTTQSAYDILMKCYENLEALCLWPLPDKEIEKATYLMFCRTLELHFKTPKNFNRHSNTKHGVSISEFNLYLLKTYPEKTKNIILKFIKSILSNLNHKFEREHFQKLLDIAVKYEQTIYYQFNESIVDYLEKLVLAADHRQRLNGTEFCGKMLLKGTQNDGSQQLLHINDIPREVYLIKMLFDKVCDKQDSVKLKALTSIKAALLNGNDNCKKIFDVFLKNNLTEDNPEIVEILQESSRDFQNNLLSLLQRSSSTYIRRTCLEILGQNCEEHLNNEIFFETLTMLSDDSSYLVKIQLIEVVNFLIVKHPKNKNILEVWLEVILNLARDNDNKIVDASVKSLTELLQRIESFENTLNDLHMLPWTIIRLIMARGKRNVLKNAINNVTTKILSQDKLRKIETHIFTSHKTEAWCILSIVAKRMKSNNPDIVVKTFLDQVDHLDDVSYDSSDFYLILEVIHNWIESFNDHSKTQIVNSIERVLESGRCSISFVSHLYETCCLTRSTLFTKDENLKFIEHSNESSLNQVINNLESFSSSLSDEKVLNFMLLYCETNTDLSQHPDQRIITFLFEFLKKVVNGDINITTENDVSRKLNCCIIILTRFAVRDAELASELSPKLGMLLRKLSMHIRVIKTSIQCLNDLCKKHTSTVAPIFNEVIYKLQSSNEEIRLCALANIYDLVMQDFIKMKGRVLLNFLACLVDKNEMIQMRSQAAILSYTNDKNPNLLYTCFIESVFLFNEFIQTETFGVFPLDEIDRNHHLLYGNDKKEQRYELYHFFVQNIFDLNEAHLLMLLKQIIVLNEKFEKKKIKKEENGIQAFEDLLYIFKLICNKSEECKLNMNKTNDNPEYIDNDHADEVQQTSTSKAKVDKKGNKMTLNDVTPILEKMILIYPSFAKHMINYDEKLEKDVDELTAAIVRNFAPLVEYSAQASFWNISQENNKKKTNRNKKQKQLRKTTVNENVSESSSDEDS
ncbi:CLUMA_CG013549, isoform A [Clunio marinus]|uniref:CLUMA_CG013549, isoform A n=1 Tax=Clunio marinus TaxID=568069 RepID=A0A1J1IL42_9DIPT|nr:CLUMA_CG013549, isoform A [Clunio marinus]